MRNVSQPEKMERLNSMTLCYFKHTFVSRFNIYFVEECAKATWNFLMEKQEKKRHPNADKEAHIMINKLEKVGISLKKQKKM